MFKTVKIIISSSWVGSYSSWVSLAVDNHSKYAERYGYKYRHHHYDSHLGTSNAAKPSDLYIDSVWQQIVDLRKLMNDPDNEWIFKTDTDSVFTNFKLDLVRFTRFKSDFIFTGDANDVFNGGHFLIRNSEWSRSFIDLWLSYKDHVWENFNTSHQSETGKLSDQPLLNMILRKYHELNDSNGRTTFNSINGFPGNDNRVIKHFWLTHAPTARYRIYFARRLLN